MARKDGKRIGRECYAAGVLAALVPTPVFAAPIVGAIAAVGAFFAGLSPLALAGIGLALSVGLTLARGLFSTGQRTKPSDQKTELTIANSLQAHRHVYGYYRMAGSPLPWRQRNEILYGCILLNSRPSEGGDPLIYMDKRAHSLISGDFYDFSAGGGARVQFADFPWFDNPDLAPRIWIGLGDQSGPPADIVSESNGIFQSSDAWTGRTVMWVRLVAGEEELRQQRWRSVPPLFEVEMKWSKVFDPRAGQDIANPATWTWSSNAALCTLDALMNNPVRQYRAEMMDLTSWSAAANSCDEAVPLSGGGTEPRYGLNGFIVWNGSEILDQVQPLVAASGGEIIPVGALFGFKPAVWHAPEVTVTDIIADETFSYETEQSEREIPRAVKAVYIAPDRDWEEAELEPTEVPGGLGVGDEGTVTMPLDMVTSATQAQRLQVIQARKLGLQKRLSVTLFPEAIELTTGSNVSVALPPHLDRVNGTYEVRGINPGLWISDVEGGIALRLPTVMQETNESVFAWDPVNEQPIENDPPPGYSLTQDPTIGGPEEFSAIPSGSTSVDLRAVIPNERANTGLLFETYQAGGVVAQETIYATGGSIIIYTQTGLNPNTPYDFRAYTLRELSISASFAAASATTPAL